MSIFSAKIPVNGVVKKVTNLDVTVDYYKDGVKIESILYPDVNPFEAIYGQIDARIKWYESVDKTDTSTLTGDVDLKNPKLVIPPTQAQMERANYNLALTKLKLMKQRVDLGALDITSKEYQDQVTLHNNLFKPEYE